MAKEGPQQGATVGVAEHGSSAVLVTVARSGECLDRRRIELIDPGLPTHPHHHEGSWAVGRYLSTPGARAMSLAEAVSLVERVRASAAHGARESLVALAAAVPVPIAAIAIRACPELPPTIQERIADNRAQTIADSVMYREALATAARARGWSVHWYDRQRVWREAAAALGQKDVDAFLHAMGRSIGPPWQATHRLATAAALGATVRAPGKPARGAQQGRSRRKAARPTLLTGGNPQIAKADGDAPVQAYIAAMPGWKRGVGRRLDALIVRSVPSVRKAVKWNSPFYGLEGRGWFLAIHVFTDYVKVTFFRGASLLPVPPGGTGKDARWIDIHEDDLDEAQMAKWIRQAAVLPGWGKA